MIRIVIVLISLFILACGVEVEKERLDTVNRAGDTDLVCYKGYFEDFYGSGTITLKQGDVNSNYGVQVIKYIECTEYNCSTYNGSVHQVKVSLYLAHNEFDLYINDKFTRTFTNVEQVSCE